MSAPSTPATVVRAEQLRAFAVEVTRAVGVPEDDATVIADGMVWAELRGIDVGIKRLPTLVSQIRQGSTVADPKPVVVLELPAFAVVDGHGAWGQVTSARAMRIAIEKARAAGVGACVVRDTGNSLAMGYYPWLAVREGMIGVAITNADPLQTAWGGTEKMLGNQAYAIGCPSGRHEPVIFDTATTAVSWVKIHEYEARGETLPPGVALNAGGEPTIEPVEALAGTLLPAGGYKGFGLALMWEILTGVLSGGEIFGRSVDGDPAPNQRCGQSTFLLAIDPSLAVSREKFLERVDTLIDQLHASPKAPGVERIVAPGERRGETARKRERDGIPLSAVRANELRALSRELGVELPEGFATS
jgi:LDH2 family malate/lactate/ureidoglycolate dehydrogenase